MQAGSRVGTGASQAAATAEGETSKPSGNVQVFCRFRPLNNKELNLGEGG